MALETKKNLVGKMVPNAVPASKQKEDKIESGNKWKKVFGYLESFKKSFAALEGGKKEKGKGIFGALKDMFSGGVKGLMTKILGGLGLVGIFAGLGGMGALILPAAIIIWGITSAFKIIQDWTEGFKSGGFTGAMAKALGGEAKGGAWSSAKGAMKWAGIGMVVGLGIGGPIGALVGALIGAAFGGFFGWLGSDRIKTALDKVTDFFGFPELMSPADKLAHQAKIDTLTAKIENLKSEVLPIIEKEIKVYDEMQAKGTELLK